MWQVLLVDDEPAIRNLLNTVLSRAGYRVREASNASQALDLLGEDLPDIIISDLMMPGLDGIELCSEVRSNPRTRGVPFVLLTAVSDPERHQQALRSGVNQVLVKPVMPRTLSQAVQVMLAQGAVAH